MWDLLGPGTELVVVLALQGRFLITGRPGGSCLFIYVYVSYT